ncbi:uncharacterized protein [Typha latifolia]|uniref:uncharacterized protein n=1 Tax=Typha latifolia TaxID=4733 RepID=UPI003C2AB625
MPNAWLMAWHETLLLFPIFTHQLEWKRYSINVVIMQEAKEKVKDMASAAKEKVMEHSAKTEGKVEEATARTREGKEMAHERAKAKEAEAKAEHHQKKAEHRQETAAHRATTHVPLTGPHHHRPVGGTHPTTDEYL